MKGSGPLFDLWAMPASDEVLKSLQLAAALIFVLPMNLAVGWPVLTLFAEGIGAGRGDTSLRRLAAWLARRTPGVAAIALVLAFPPYLLGVVIYGEAWLVAAQRMGWFWLALLPLVFIGTGGAFWVALRRRGTEPSTMRPFLPDIVESYILAFRRRGLERPGMTLTVFSAGALLAAGFVLVTHAVLLERPGLWEAGGAVSSGLTLPLHAPQWLPRLLHMLLGAIAVSGFAVAWHGADRMAAGEPGYGRTALSFGALWFMVPTGLQILAGPWLLYSLSSDLPAQAAGEAAGVPLSALPWAGGVCGVLAFILVAVALRVREPQVIIRTAAALLVCSLAAMTAARQQVRAQLFEKSAILQDRTVVAEPEMMTLFAIIAGIAALLLAYMLFISRRPAEEREE